MKILFVLLSAFFLATGWAFPGGLDKVILNITSVSTTASPSEASSVKITGYIERVDMWFNQTTNPCNIKVVSSNEYTGSLVSMMSEAIRSTNITIYPRINYDNPTGGTLGTNYSNGRILLQDEKLYMIATNGTVGIGHQNVKARVIYERP